MYDKFQCNILTLNDNNNDDNINSTNNSGIENLKIFNVFQFVN